MLNLFHILSNLTGDLKAIYITPTQGLRQGDPVSPYLFFICAKSLSALLKKNVDNGLMKGAAACSRGLEISHLFFTDDSLIFCRATREDCSSLEHVLETYEQASGQQLNWDKASLKLNHEVLIHYC